MRILFFCSLASFDLATLGVRHSVRTPSSDRVRLDKALPTFL